MRKRQLGRPPGSGKPIKPPEELFESISIAFPPDLLARFRAAVPAGERAAFIRRAVDEAIAPAGRRPPEAPACVEEHDA